MNAPVQTPKERLARSRARIVSALISSQKTLFDESRPERGILSDLLSMYLAQHPLRAAGSLVNEAVRNVVVPWARKHPLLAVVGAAALGAVVVWGRPWRWIRTPALLAGLLPQLVSKLMAQRKV